MNVEQLDGFFAAFIAGPKTVMPSEYNREVFGGEMSEACVVPPNADGGNVRPAPTSKMEIRRRS